MSCTELFSGSLELSCLESGKISGFMLETGVLTFVQDNTMPVCREQTSCILFLPLKLLQLPVQRYRVVRGEDNIIIVEEFAILLSSLPIIDKNFNRRWPKVSR
jgi:hypothetical protein